MNLLFGVPVSLVQRFFSNRSLIIQMTKRKVIGRYQGSVLGLFRSFLNPLFMLVIYTFVFGIVFKARWGGTGDQASTTDFAIILFSGLIIHGLLALRSLRHYDITTLRHYDITTLRHYALRITHYDDSLLNTLYCSTKEEVIAKDQRKTGI